MARQIPNSGEGGLVKTIARDLDRPGPAWWRTATWRRVQTDYADEPAVQVLVAFANQLRAGADPVWMTGGTTGADAVRAAQEWLDADVKVEEVEPWLRAGCWSADVAARLSDAGLPPDAFMDGDEPLLYFHGPYVAVPLLDYVIDRTVTIDEAAKFVAFRKRSGF
jgi:hypothetical protein